MSSSPPPSSVPHCKNMSDNNIKGGSDHDESIGGKIEVIHAEMTSIHSDFTSTALSRDDEGEITAELLEETTVQSSVRINVYENIPFAGGDGDYSVLSVLFGAHSIGEGIFGFLNMIDSNKVRVQCRECHQAVKDFPWMDSKSKIKGSVKAWRAAFPVARAVNVSKRNDIVDEDFVHIRGDARVRLHTVYIEGCKRVTDAAFIRLRGIHRLDMDNCNQETITDAAFIHLRGIHTLFMVGCNQATVTDAAFVHLRGIRLLFMNGCNQETVTDAAFINLRGIHMLFMGGCNQATITDAAFEYLRGIHTLFMGGCNQETITDGAFIHLRGIQMLSMSGCNQATITDAAFVHLRGILELYMSGCNQPTITDAALVNLVGIQELDTERCSRDIRIAAAQVMGIDYESEIDEDEDEDEDLDENEDDAE